MMEANDQEEKIYVKCGGKKDWEIPVNA